jgi:Ca2+:H+ antiporter
VVGKAAERSTAVIMAIKNRMELSIGIAIGSSLRALFVAPVLVTVSHFIGPRPMALVFTPAEVLAIFCRRADQQSDNSDGESNWLEGALLLTVYLILASYFSSCRKPHRLSQQSWVRPKLITFFRFSYCCLPFT